MKRSVSVLGQGPVDLSSHESFEAAHDVLLVHPLLGAAFDLGAGAFVEANAGEHDGLQGVVGGPVAAAVEAAVLRPDVAGVGATPATCANTASERIRWKASSRLEGDQPVGQLFQCFAAGTSPRREPSSATLSIMCRGPWRA